MATVAAFGELLLRLDAPGRSRLTQAGRFEARYTGGEANVAVALAQWGARTRAVSKVPAHDLGQACIDFLRAYGVNTDWVLRGGERLGLLYVETGADQRPAAVVYDRRGSSFSAIQPGEIDWEALLPGVDWLHVTGTAPALGPNVRAVLHDGLRAARRLGVTVSFDTNYRSALWSVEDASRALGELMPWVDVFVGSPHDARSLFGIDAEPARSAELMRQRFGFRCVAYTLRDSRSASVNRLAGLLCDEAGCAVSREHEMEMVDRIGGGDAFTAGLIHGLLSSWERQRAVEFAAAAACLKHAIPGDFLLASLQEVEQLMPRSSS
jgi:2-dehydro-3-deoxygluconokinase